LLGLGSVSENAFVKFVSVVWIGKSKRDDCWFIVVVKIENWIGIHVEKRG